MSNKTRPAQTPTITPGPDIESIDEFFRRCPTAEEVGRVNSDLRITFEYDPVPEILASPDNYRLAALQDAEVTCLTRFCKEIYTQPTVTLMP